MTWKGHPNGPSSKVGTAQGRSGLFFATTVGWQYSGGSSATLGITFKQRLCWDNTINAPTSPLARFDSSVSRGGQRPAHVYFLHLRTNFNNNNISLESWGTNTFGSEPVINLPPRWVRLISLATTDQGTVTTFSPVTGARTWVDLPTMNYRLNMNGGGPTVVASNGDVYEADPDEFLSMYIRFGNHAAIPTVISGSPTSTNNSVNIEWDRIPNADGYYVGTVDAHNVESSPIEVAQTASGNPSYTFSSLAPSSTYSFYVKAWNYNNGISFTEPTKTTSLPRVISATTAARAAPPSSGGDGTDGTGGTTPELVPGVNRTLDTPTWNYITEVGDTGVMWADWTPIENANSYSIRLRDDAPADNIERLTFREEFVRTQATYFASTWGWAARGVYPGNALNGLLEPTNDEYPKLTLTSDNEQPYLKGLWINGTTNTATMVIAGNHSALLGGNRAPTFQLEYNIITDARSQVVRLTLDPPEASNLVNAPVSSDDHLGASRFGGVQTTITWDLFDVGGFEIARPNSSVAQAWSLKSYRAIDYSSNPSRISVYLPAGRYHARVKALASTPAYDSGWSSEIPIYHQVENFVDPFLTPAAFVQPPDPENDLGVRSFAKGIGLTPEGSSTDTNTWALAASIMLPIVIGGIVFTMSGDPDSGQRPVFLPMIIANTLWIPASIYVAQINIFWSFFPSLLVIILASAVLYKRYV